MSSPSPSAFISTQRGVSRRQYLRFVESMDLTTTLHEHVRAFQTDLNPINAL